MKHFGLLMGLTDDLADSPSIVSHCNSPQWYKLYPHGMKQMHYGALVGPAHVIIGNSGPVTMGDYSCVFMSHKPIY